jgi:hypothetical protein
VLSHWVAPTGNADLLNEIYLAWAMPVTAYLAIRCFLRGARLRRRQAGPQTGSRNTIAVIGHAAITE